MRNIMIGAALLGLLSGPSFAATDIDCDAMFVKADIDVNGSLADTEATGFMDILTKAGRPMTAPLTREQFVTECKAGAFKDMAASTAPAPGNATTETATTTDTTTTMTTTAMVPMGSLIVGANSFTEAQARDRIEKNGVSAVTGLAKDDTGIWRGSATKDGKPVKVGLDFKGNIAVE